MHRNASDGLKANSRLVKERVNWSLVQNWMQDCAESHGTQCNPPNSGFSEGLYLLLIDVKQMRLVKRGWGSRYLALSYVWGKAETFNTVRDNIEELQQDGALLFYMDRLPQVIKDAIEFVRDIGETHIWVDALCIIQDDPQFKAAYIAFMDKIFGQALLTIIALSGQDANSGLPGLTAGSRPLIPTPVNLGPLKLVAKLPSLFIAVQRSMWNTRAWTFQEGLFSRKKLFFSESQVHWCCPKAYHSEDYSPVFEVDSGIFRDMSVMEQSIGNDPRERFHIYESLVKRYSNRDMTYHSDSLHAFAGALSALKDAFEWKFTSALPENCLDLALLWRPMSSVRLRPRSLSDQDWTQTACKSPSWCWTAWKGDIFWDPWRLDSYANKSVSLKTEVGTFVVKDSGSFHQITREESHDSDHLTGRGRQLAARCHDIDLPSRATLCFEAKTASLDLYKILSPDLESRCVANAGESKSSSTDPLKRWDLRMTLRIYDDKGHHCGTLYGLSPSWTLSHDTTQCELVLLSRCDQNEVTQADIETYQDKLPPEYPSAVDYYEEVFDMSYYRYKRWWAMNILLVEWKGNTAQRVAVGRIHADAWYMVRHKVKQIVLA